MSYYAEGTTLDFRVQGVVRADGRVQIGCKDFTALEIGDVARDLKMTEPPKPEFQKGDVYVDYSGAPRWRDERGVWRNSGGMVQAPSDARAEAIVTGNFGYRFVIKDGVAV